jgi:hypothetical protein
MSAPEYVPNASTTIRSYSSPPRRPESWLAGRPGELGAEGQPVGEQLGSPGPDQGYVYKLLPMFRTKVHLAEGQSWDDVAAGAAAIALKRASLYGRAPVVHDLTAAFGIWGFLEPSPPADLVENRGQLFAGVANPHHYTQLRALVDVVPESTLRLPLGSLRTAGADWRSRLDRGAAAHH